MSKHFSILLLQPDTIDTDVLKIMLANDQLIINHLSNSTDAWNHIHGTQYCDLIVLNLNIPDGNQFHISSNKLLDGIQSDSNWKNIPLIIITNELTKKDFKKYKLAYKTELIIINPFNPVVFIQQVYNLINLNLKRHIDEVNNQHLQLSKKIFDINMLISLNHSDPEIYAAFIKLKLFINIHFDFEESFMKNHHYDDSLSHIKHHRKIRKHFSSMMNSVSKIFSYKEIGYLQENFFNDMNHDTQYISFLQDIKLEHKH